MKAASRTVRKIYSVLFRAYGHRHWWPGDSSFEIIVGAILTQNTSWKNVEKAIARIKTHAALRPRTLHRMPEKKLTLIIRPAGYFNVKANRIKNFLDFLYNEYKGSISRMFQRPGHLLRQELLQVKGIGPETADSILLYAGGKPFFVVDAYTKRIFSRHDFFSSESTYEEIQRFFTQHLPADPRLFNDYHAQIVHIAKTFCFKTNPDCSSCPLKFLFKKN